MRYQYKSFLLVIILISVLSSCSKKGCTDPMSLAYDAESKKDDGSCTYPEVSKKSLVYKKNRRLVSLLWRICNTVGK